MKIQDYNQMMAYLTRPATPTLVASAETDALKEKFNEQLGEGTIKTLDELPPVKDPFKEFEDRQQAASGGVIGEGGMFQGEDLGNRTGFSGIRKNIESVDGEPYVKTFETGTGAKKYGAFYSRQGFNRRSTFDRTPEGLQKAIEARNKFDLEFEKFKIDKGTLDPAVKKLKNPPDSKKPWRYQRPNKPIEYFATEKQALDFQQKARTAKIEAGTKVPKTDFAKIKKQIINGTTLEELADEYKSGKEAITNLLKNNKTSYSQLSPSESYLDDIDSLKYIEDNYGKLKGETLGKNLYPDLKPSTQISRIRKLSTKLIKQNKLKPIPANLVLETREEKGFNPSESAKKASDDRGVKIKKFSVPAFEAAMSGNFKSQLSHMDDLGSQIVRFETLGYSPQKINQKGTLNQLIQLMTEVPLLLMVQKGIKVLILLNQEEKNTG